MPLPPLSQRRSPNPEFEGPYDGIPEWMFPSVQKWLRTAIQRPSGGLLNPSAEILHAAERRLHVTFDWEVDEWWAFNSALRQMHADPPTFGLDFIDFMLNYLRSDTQLVELSGILRESGSLWEVQKVGNHFALVQRTTGPVRDSIEHLGSTDQRAHDHLVLAWNKLMGRNPDPSSAYREAIRAVEVVAAPVVTPNDPSATLGKIIAALRAKPSKWTVDLAEATPEQVTQMLAMIWQSQFDRHGTYDESVPLNVSQDQADAAVHVAIALTRLFAGGHIKAV